MCQNLKARSKVIRSGQQKSLQASAEGRKLLRLGRAGKSADSKVLGLPRPKTRILKSGTRYFFEKEGCVLP